MQAKPVLNEDVEKLKKTLVEEKMKKEQAVNKLAEIMNRKEFRNQGNRKNTASAQELKKKEKECRKLQQELGMVSLNLLIRRTTSFTLGVGTFCEQGMY